jgi:hypothetical protein
MFSAKSGLLKWGDVGGVRRTGTVTLGGGDEAEDLEGVSQLF